MNCDMCGEPLENDCVQTPDGGIFHYKCHHSNPSKPSRVQELTVWVLIAVVPLKIIAGLLRLISELS